MTTPLPSGRRAARDSASERKALWEAAHGGRLDDVRRCLDAGVSVDAVYQGSTPLWYAAYYGHAEVVRLLLERGANPKARNRAGRKARDVICGGCYGRDRAVLRAEVEDIFPFEEADQDAHVPLREDRHRTEEAELPVAGRFADFRRHAQKHCPPRR